MNNYQIQYNAGVAVTLQEVNDFMVFFNYSQQNNRGIISNLVVDNALRKVRFTYSNYASPLLVNSPNSNISGGIIQNQEDHPFVYAQNCVIKFLSEPTKPNDAGGTIAGIIDYSKFIDDIVELHSASVLGNYPAITKGTILHALQELNGKTIAFEVVEVAFNTVTKQVVYVLDIKQSSNLHEEFSSH